MGVLLCLPRRCLGKAGSDRCSDGDREVDLIDDTRAVVEGGEFVCSLLSGRSNEFDEWLVCECVVGDSDEQ